VVDILSELKKVDRPATASKKYPSMKKGDLETSGERPLVEPSSIAGPGSGSMIAGAAASAAAKTKKKKFGSLKPLDKKSSTLDLAGKEELDDEMGRKYHSMKREDFKAHSAAFGAIELKDMVAAARPADPPAANGGAPKRRFASMKRENYKSFKQAGGDSEKRDFDEAGDDSK
jgi:hypothetical protein